MISLIRGSLISRAICFFRGHKRGRPAEYFYAGRSVTTPGFRTFACPRCGRETRYKVKQP